MRCDAVVIGGGCAGLAAATALAEAGLQVTLIEKRHFLGGRTYSIRDRKTGEWIDNGQHLLMGCYHETIAWLRQIGAQSGVCFQPTLEISYRGPNGFFDSLKCTSLPSPFHLLIGLIRLRSLQWKDIWPALRMGLAIRRYRSERKAETVSELCRRLRQTENINNLLWNPITLSALNESPDTADAGLFCQVMAQSFLGSAKDSRLVLPMVPLQQLFGEPADDYIRNHGGDVVVGQSVERLICSQNRITEVVLSSGENLYCDYCISAVPQPALQAILERSQLRETIPVTHLGASPILGVYLWFERPISQDKLCCLSKTEFEWVFHRSNFMKPGEHKLYCVCLVISAARNFLSKSREELIRLAIADIHSVYPESKTLTPISASVFWEPQATFSAIPDHVKRRPVAKTSIPNFFLAGDWTDTGLPATIEGAVRSGRRSAELVLKSI